MSSPGQSSGTTRAADDFEDLWRQLGECHQNALQELEAKVSKLKKDRCLDAQRLELFYTRNQQLKEQNKALQDAISLLEERLRTGECDRCVILEENLKNNQDQNLKLIAKLKNESSRLEDENRKLSTELQKLKMLRSTETSSLEDEDSIIPDSPIMPSSLPAVNKLKKRKNTDRVKHVRYTEMPLLQSNNSLFNELIKDPVGASKNPGRTDVLVPNTCELDAPKISKDVNEERFIAETCGFELHTEIETAASLQSSTKTSRQHEAQSKPHCSSRPLTLIHSPDSTSERSPSLLPRVKRFSEDGSICKAKRKKDLSDPEVEDSKKGVHEGEGEQKQPITPVRSQSFNREPLDSKGHFGQNETSSQKPNVSCVSPAFKKPNVKAKADVDGKTRTSLQNVKSSHGQHEAKDSERKRAVEPTWSIDPALALSMYDTEYRGDEEMEEQQHHELADTDCTWVSHSLLQARDRGDGVPGLGEKANDSLDMLFETTAYGEYKSYNSLQLEQSQHCNDDDDKQEEEEDNEEDPHENTCQNKAKHPTFAHVAVVRKKAERRKLKGTTCKECEIYYAHLPEEEKQKKLSACSRHRFLYIPPCTPENFWEVGFPSTQTCIDRGYIKEEKNPQARLRRRQPLNALFSPKQNE
ncbi:DNA endonuclease RBBP8 isoform X1 [Mugil cephalus]|uniref:DNA endonuclease RBBP8 isoform X1 n=1 Tax=Mugil cephalus TaxID=48193 RepID=UPI001FB6C30C|nr:DNA endonuclease RBBP8 isoform X1 [Mugil cephalus]